MAETRFFDSLVHANRSGEWLQRNHFDASLERLLAESKKINSYRACIVNIAGFSDNDELEKIARDHRDLFVPIAGCNPTDFLDDKALRRELAELRERGFAGIKLHPRLNEYDPLDGRCLAAVKHAASFDLVVFLDTLFRQKRTPISHPADIIDRIAHSCPDTNIVLLHGAASAMLDIYEIVRMRSNLLLDTSFTLMRYSGSSLDADMRFVFQTLDQRVTSGSDFPEYVPVDALDRLQTLLENVPQNKAENVLFRNLSRFLSDWLVRYT